MEKEKPSYYAIIPAGVRYDTELKPNEKLLYGEITALTNQNGICTASNKYFANLYNVEQETVSRWVSNLVEKGYIRLKLIKENGAIKNRELSIDKEVTGVLIKKSIGIDKKVKENIYIKNIFNKLNISKFFEDKDLNNAYQDYLKMRFRKGQKNTLDEEQVKKQLKKYQKVKKELLLSALEESTMYGWLGIFIKEEKKDFTNKKEVKTPQWFGQAIKNKEMTEEEIAEFEEFKNNFKESEK